MVWLLGFSQLFKLFLPKYKRQNKKIMILPSSPVFLPERFFLENQILYLDEKHNIIYFLNTMFILYDKPI